MTLYVIIAFVCILIGMAISVYAFGTGSKRAKIFKEIYYSIEDIDGIGVLYTKTGEYSKFRIQSRNSVPTSIITTTIPV